MTASCRRVGFAANQDEGAVELPASVEQLESAFEVVEEPPSEPAFDFIWNSLVEDEREKRLLRTAVTVNPETAPPFDESPTNVQIAEAALKVCAMCDSLIKASALTKWCLDDNGYRA